MWDDIQKGAKGARGARGVRGQYIAIKMVTMDSSRGIHRLHDV